MALLPDIDRAGQLAGVLAVHPGDLGMCEMASGEVVPVDVETLPVKPRRGASVRIDALGGRAGPVVALHPLRVSDPAEIGDSGPGSEGADSTASVERRLDEAEDESGWVEASPAGDSQGKFPL